MRKDIAPSKRALENALSSTIFDGAFIFLFIPRAAVTPSGFALHSATILIKDYQELQNPHITLHERTNKIQNIVKNIFRILLAVSYLAITFPAIEQNQKAFTALILIISPAASLFALATLCSWEASALLVNGILQESRLSLEDAILMGIAAFIASECSEDFPIKNLEDYIITPLSNQVAKAFI